MVALGEVDALVAAHLEDLRLRDELGHRALAQVAGDADDRAHDRPVDLRLVHVGDELAVDLHVVEDQVLEVVERPEPGTEVVEREGAAQLGHPLHDRLERGPVVMAVGVVVVDAAVKVLI